ncbi:hypothetical protein EDD11_003474 [Mortierella claussenii]|nr:hypothetical protein EDD11_003474 [Mortierella claussenii]
MAPASGEEGKGILRSEATSRIHGRAGAVAFYALISRLVIWAIAAASHALVQDYDSALELVLPTETLAQQVFKGVFGVFLRWDAFYFLHIAEYGYVFEQAHAFFPLLPALMKLVAATVLAPFGALLSYRQQLVLAGILVSNASFVAAAVQIYRLSNALFEREQFAFLTAMLYVLAPSGIFMSAIYTESLFAALSFSGMLFAARKQYLLAAIIWSISGTARSNGILYVGFFIYDLIVQINLQSSTLCKLKTMAKASFLCLITWTGCMAVQAYGYFLYCSGASSGLEARSWCHSALPSIYTFVQDFYWNVGFLRYYEIKQIPNFLMAAPMVTLSTLGILVYVVYDLPRAISLGRTSRHTARDPSEAPFLSTITFPYIVLWAVLLLSAVTTMHIQIITRAFSCLPPVYWFAAHQYERGAFGAGWTKTCTVFFVMYGLVGIILFANFFPPA